MDNNQINPYNNNAGFAQNVSTPPQSNLGQSHNMQTPTSFGSVFQYGNIYPTPDNGPLRHFNTPGFMNHLMTSQNVQPGYTVHTLPPNANVDFAQTFSNSVVHPNVNVRLSNVQAHERLHGNDLVQTPPNDDQTDGLDEHGLPIVDHELEQRLEATRQESLALKKRLGLDRTPQEYNNSVPSNQPQQFYDIHTVKPLQGNNVNVPHNSNPYYPSQQSQPQQGQFQHPFSGNQPNLSFVRSQVNSFSVNDLNHQHNRVPPYYHNNMGLLNNVSVSGNNNFNSAPFHNAQHFSSVPNQQGQQSFQQPQFPLPPHHQPPNQQYPNPPFNPQYQGQQFQQFNAVTPFYTSQQIITAHLKTFKYELDHWSLLKWIQFLMTYENHVKLGARGDIVKPATYFSSTAKKYLMTQIDTNLALVRTGTFIWNYPDNRIVDEVFIDSLVVDEFVPYATLSLFNSQSSSVEMELQRIMRHFLTTEAKIC